MKTVYLDYNATTPLDPAVRDAMLPYLGEVFGNPSSVHHVGRRARLEVLALQELVDRDRCVVPVRELARQVYEVLLKLGMTRRDAGALLSSCLPVPVTCL